MTRTQIAAIAVAALALTAAAGCGGGSSARPATSSVLGAHEAQGAKTLVGAGSTLVAPLLAQWSHAYERTAKVAVNYGAIGSGGGIAALTSRTVDFGASDAPLSAGQRGAAGAVLQLPWALAATVVAVNLPGIKSHVRLTGPVLADIYRGKIGKWNDPRIVQLNHGVALPSKRITVVYRSDSSGDTYAFTHYLTRVSASWAKEVGADTSVSWPTGVGAKGNSGVAAALAQTPGAIAYVAIGQASSSRLDVALLKNRAGKYPVPGTASIAAAAAGVEKLGPGNAVSLVDPPASKPNAYPIATFTYVIVRRRSPKAAALKGLIGYAITTGQRVAPRLSFAPLPAGVVAADRKAIAGL